MSAVPWRSNGELVGRPKSTFIYRHRLIKIAKNEFTFDVTLVKGFCWLERTFGVKVDAARSVSGQRTRALREIAQRVSIDNILCDFLFFHLQLQKITFHKTRQKVARPSSFASIQNS